MPEDSHSIVRSRFSQQRYAADFGRYEGTRSAEYPAHEFLIGREGQRAHLLNLLQTFGRRGAFLVTGHRGSGKTTFVRFCLGEYADNIFRRYLRVNAGRPLFWDRLGHLAFGVVWIVAALLLCEELQELARRPEHGVLDWCCMLLLALLCAYPLLVAKEILDVALTPGILPVREARKLAPWLGLRPALNAAIVIGIAALAVFLGGALGRPELAISQLIVLGAWIYFVVNYLSVGAPQSRAADPGSEDPSISLARRPWRHGLFELALIGGAVLSTPLWPASHVSGEASAIVWLNWFTAVALVSLGAVRRGWDQRALAKIVDRPRGQMADSATAGALRSSSSWYIFGGGALAALSVIALVARRSDLDSVPHIQGWAVGAGLAALLLAAGGGAWRWRQSRRSPADFSHLSLHPRSRVLLAFKSLVMLVLGLQLCAPLLLAIQLPEGLALVRRMPHSEFSLAARLDANKTLFGAGSAPHTEMQEICWLAGVALLLCLCVFLEYEWIVRPYAKVRDDEALHRSRGSDGPRLDAEEQRADGGEPFRLPRSVRLQYHQFAEKTFFWKSFRAWLPVLVIPVNLGFDSLEHRHVVESMLAGLKEQYRRTFLHWSSPLVMVRRLLVGALVVSLTLFLGQGWFDWSPNAPRRDGAAAAPTFCPLDKAPADKVALAVASVPAAAAAASAPEPQLALKPLQAVVCKVGGESLAQLLQWRPFVVTGPPAAVASAPSPGGGPPARQHADGKTGASPGLLLFKVVQLGGEPPRLGSLHMYHLVILVLFLLIYSRIARSLPIAPHRQMFDRISRLLDSLSSSLREEMRSDGSRLAQMAAIAFGTGKVEGREFGPFDPRTVELNFIQILADCVNPVIQLPFTARHRVNPPMPEIIFVFDELDKLGSRAPQEPERGEGVAAPGREPPREPRHPERERARSLHRLFADLKNILSSGSARFIFIGGQNLHDEWLADQSARTPRLSNTFEAEIHLPSLLTDDAADGGGSAPGPPGIRAFVKEHWQRARHLHTSWQDKATAPWLWLAVEDRQRAAFVQGRDQPADAAGGRPFALVVRRLEDGREWSCSAQFSEAFFAFLAYRSRGNVKKLRGLLESFMRPLPRFVSSDEVRRRCFDCEHILLFRDSDRFRIQLVADVFRQLRPSLDERLAFGDDKLAQAVFSLADFLLKFHRRAFSWSNLGRVDELTHIHRAPDLRLVLEEMVLNWSATYLHLINNGMYDYRFESEFARELEFLSHGSEQELAAFNFTLDESEVLKATYRSQYAALGGDTERIDFIVGLGELHEFDEELETARAYYLRAARALDEKFSLLVMKKKGSAVFLAVANQEADGYAAARRVATWGVARVRLMLQIGMTYERARDFEHAQIEYRDARTVASAIIQALLGWSDGEDAIDGRSWQDFEVGGHDRGGYLWTLKSISILFHPIFAEAWLAEKSVSGVETGPSLLEKELSHLRSLLPFVSAGFNENLDPEDPVHVQHSNFALTMAELHNRAGSLYFYKGRQLARAKDVEARSGGGAPAGGHLPTAGYLLRALYHYAVSLQEVRRFNRYRREGSKFKTNDLANPKERSETIAERSWPEFVIRVTAGALSNLAESLLAGVSAFGLLTDLKASGGEDSSGAAGFDFSPVYDTIGAWLDGPTNRQESQMPSVAWGARIADLFPGWCIDRNGRIEDWLGDAATGPSNGSPRSTLLAFSKLNSNAERLAASLTFSLAGARLLGEAGYPEGSEQEYLRVAKTVASVLWWVNFLLYLDRIEPAAPEAKVWAKVAREALADRQRVARRLAPLVNLAIAALEEAHRRVAEQVSAGVGGDSPPAAGAITLAASLALATFGLEEDLRWPICSLERHAVLRNLVEAPAPGAAILGPGVRREWFRERLMESLDRHSFPVHNRLCGLKALVDNALVSPPTVRLLKEQSEHLAELIELDDLYRSPLHFTALHSGLTLGLAFAAGRGFPDLPAPPRIDLKREALRRLEDSQRLYTMRRTYYESISGLYYLYDDFNDRTIHYNQAIQMAGSDIASYMIAVLSA